jgi:phospholipase C
VSKTESTLQGNHAKALRQGIAGSLVCLSLANVLISCSGTTQPFAPLMAHNNGANYGHFSHSLPTPIQHVVIIFQENRTPDNLFQGLPDADIAKTAVDSKGDVVALHATSLAVPWDLGHNHVSFVRDYHNGKMNGFDKGFQAEFHLRPFAYAPRSEVQPYYDMAKQYVFGDHMFQSNQGPSFPSHLYIVTGTATDPSIASYRVASNSAAPPAKATIPGCDAQANATVLTISPADGSEGPTPFPCFDRPALSDFLDDQHLTWRYYQHRSAAGLRHAFDAIRHVRYGPDYANVIDPPETILTDISKGRLAALSWVMPDNAHSDHAGVGSTRAGPSWVAAVVNAVGKSKYWPHTAIFVTWDDWGGWYDHVPPPIINHYELGFRVPLLVISPYAKIGYVSKVKHEFGSILAFSEEVFGIRKGALDATDKRSDDLMDAFNFSQKPRTFVLIKAPPFHPSASHGIEDP